MRIRKQLLKRIITAAAVFIMIPLIILLIYLIVRADGRNRLYDGASGAGPVIDTGTENLQVEIIEDDGSYDWQEGDVRYNGEIYRYNDRILTILIMGIDKKGTVEGGEVRDNTDGGQSDAMFLAVINPDKKRTDIIAINRNTMADVDVYDKAGAYTGTEKLQLTLQHGYGDGRELSCERTVNAVSRFMYGIPVHGYVAVNMGAVQKINDAVGGVDVRIDRAVMNASGNINGHVGETVTLMGDDAYAYIHNRDINEYGSADERLLRQKEYIKAFAKKAVQKTKEDITFPVRLYGMVSGYAVTDIPVSGMGYLAGEVLSCGPDDISIRTVEGSTVMGDEFEEFYPDEEALLGLIMDVFYEKP